MVERNRIPLDRARDRSSPVLTFGQLSAAALTLLGFQASLDRLVGDVEAVSPGVLELTQLVGRSG